MDRIREPKQLAAFRSQSVELPDSKYWRHKPQTVGLILLTITYVCLLLGFFIEPLVHFNEELGKWLDESAFICITEYGIGFRPAINVAVSVGVGAGVLIAVFVRCFSVPSTGVYTYCRLAFDGLQFVARVILCITWSRYANNMNVFVIGLTTEPHSIYNMDYANGRCRFALTDMKAILERQGYPPEDQENEEYWYPKCDSIKGGEDAAFKFTRYSLTFKDDDCGSVMRNLLALDYFCAGILFCNVLVRIVEAGGNARAMRVYDFPSVVGGPAADARRAHRRATRSGFKLALFHPLWLDVFSLGAIIYMPYWFEQGTRYNGMMFSGVFRFLQLFEFVSCLENTYTEYIEQEHKNTVARIEKGHAKGKGCCARIPLPKLNTYQVFLFLLFWRLVIFIIMCSALFMSIELPCSTFQEKECGDLWKDFSACIYFTVCTISTVGYGDISPKTPQGRYAVSIVILITIAILPGWLERMVKASADEKQRQRTLAAARAGQHAQAGGHELQPLRGGGAAARYAGTLRQRFSAQQLSWACFALGIGRGAQPGDGAAAAAALARELVAPTVAGDGGQREKRSTEVGIYHPSGVVNTVARGYAKANKDGGSMAASDSLGQHPDHDDHHALGHCPDKHGHPGSWASPKV